MDLELRHIDDSSSCLKCDESIVPGSRFCKYCGALQITEEPPAQEKLRGLIPALLLFASDLIICLSLAFIDQLKSFNWLLIADAISAVLVVFFLSYNWHSNRQLLKWPNFSIQKLAAYCGIAMLCSVAVHYSVTWFNLKVFDDDSNYYYYFLINGKNKWWLLAMIAVYPAIFEELAYRGFILQRFLKTVDASQAVFITSFMFGLIHLSAISLVWLIPFAILLGRIRLKERTIWYGVFFHFCFNLVACLFDIF